MLADYVYQREAIDECIQKDIEEKEKIDKLSSKSKPI